MPAKQYSVMLEQDQRESLIGLITTGNQASARKLTRARILLKADEGEFGPAYADKQIQEAVEVSASTIERTRKTFVREGLEAALTPKKPSKPSRPKKFDGEKEAHLIALACSDPPQGSACWTLRLLAEKMVELKHFSSISHECIRQVLKKTNSDRGSRNSGVFRRKPQRRSSLRWRTSLKSTSVLKTRHILWCVLMKRVNNISKTRETRYRWNPRQTASL